MKKNPFEAKQTLGKLQARAAQRELLRESKGTKAKLKKCVLKFASDSNEKMFFKLNKAKNCLQNADWT